MKKHKSNLLVAFYCAVRRGFIVSTLCCTTLSSCAGNSGQQGLKIYSPRTKISPTPPKITQPFYQTRNGRLHESEQVALLFPVWCLANWKGEGPSKPSYVLPLWELSNLKVCNGINITECSNIKAATGSEDKAGTLHKQYCS